MTNVAVHGLPQKNSGRRKKATDWVPIVSMTCGGLLRAVQSTVIVARRNGKLRRGRANRLGRVAAPLW